MNPDLPYVGGRGPISPKMMIVGESPSYQEVRENQPFVGPSGRELDKLLKDAGIPRHECWVTNLIKYEVIPGPAPFLTRCRSLDINVDQCLEELQKEINQVKPNCILALGKTALWGLTGKKNIKNYRGSILIGMGRKVVGTYHPAHLLYYQAAEFKGYWNRLVMIHDMKRAWSQAQFSELILPNRLIQICRSSAQFQEFIDRNYSNDILSVDTESTNCIPSVVGFSFNPREALVLSLWNNISGAPSIPDSDLVRIWILLDHLLSTRKIVGQNFKHDQDKLVRLGFTIGELHDDTMLKSFAINPELPKSLAFNTSIYTEEPFYKDEGMYEGSFSDLLIGCGRDACVTLEINQRMESELDELGVRDFYRNFILKLHNSYLKTENIGFRIDTEARDNLIRKYVRWDEELSYQLFKLTGDVVNVNSPKQVSILLYNVLKLHDYGGTGEEALTKIINNRTISEEKKQIVSLILKQRRVKKTISSYLMALPDFDGRMRTSCFLCLETGRTSTGKLGEPIRPTIEFKKGSVKKHQEIGLAFQTITKHGDIGSDVRSMFIPDEGEIFIQLDSSQAEARVVFLLAEDYEALKLVDEIDYHAHTAVWFFGPNEELFNYDKKKLGYEHPIRFAGKTLRHACHLMAGKARAASEVNTQARKYGIDFEITEYEAGKAIEKFHNMQPKIKSVFHKTVTDIVSKTRMLTAPLPYGIDAPHGGVRTFFERYGDELFRQAMPYIPQRAVSDNTKAAKLRIEDRLPYIKIILESHDSLLLSAPIERKEEVAKIGKEEMERPISFKNCSIVRPDLVIPCEVEMGMNYQDLKKFRFISLPVLEVSNEPN